MHWALGRKEESRTSYLASIKEMPFPVPRSVPVTKDRSNFSNGNYKTVHRYAPIIEIKQCRLLHILHISRGFLTISMV